MKNLSFLLLLFLFAFMSQAQHLALPFPEADKQGLARHLDSTYKSALHSDTALAVFKSEQQQEAMTNAYVKLLQDFGKFLTANNYAWEKQTRSFNRIYFNADGSIDYFLYSFSGKPEDQPSGEKQNEFRRLLNLFIQDYKIDLTAPTGFAQCSPTVYK